MDIALICGGGRAGEGVLRSSRAGRKAKGRRNSFPTCVIFSFGEHTSQQSLSANVVCRGTK